MQLWDMGICWAKSPNVQHKLLGDKLCSVALTNIAVCATSQQYVLKRVCAHYTICLTWIGALKLGRI